MFPLSLRAKLYGLVKQNRLGYSSAFYEGTSCWTLSSPTLSTNTSAHSVGWSCSSKRSGGHRSPSGGRWDPNKSITSWRGSSKNTPGRSLESRSWPRGESPESDKISQRETNKHSGRWTYNLTCMSVDCGRKPAYLGRSRTRHRENMQTTTPRRSWQTESLVWKLFLEIALIKDSVERWLATRHSQWMKFPLPPFFSGPSSVQPSCSYLWPWVKRLNNCNGWPWIYVYKLMSH